MDSLRDSVEMAGAFSAEKLERLEFAGGVLAGERSTNKALNMFFIDKYQSNHGVNMSNYTFNAEAHGQFGDGGTANFAENLYQGGATSDEMNALVRELDQLYVALNENTDGSAQAKKEASAIENAKEAADRGDQKGVIHYLKSTGQWTLDIAAKIGVPVAVAAIKKAIGA
ncbi:MAG: hypothetical protein GYB51_04335 [Rhodobacteraceae bacterium]|nr:hypothetical protein [Paracoccaceae bacterium]